jgi:hypothetical protein
VVPISAQGAVGRLALKRTFVSEDYFGDISDAR